MKGLVTLLRKSNANEIRWISLFVLAIFRRKFERKFDRKFKAFLSDISFEQKTLFRLILAMKRKIAAESVVNHKCSKFRFELTIDFPRMIKFTCRVNNTKYSKRISNLFHSPRQRHIAFETKHSRQKDKTP